MIELIQFPFSPYCIVIRRLLEYAGVRFKTTNIPPSDRSLIWRLTKQRYYAVPVIRDGSTVVYESEADSQVIAKYLDEKFSLALFPASWEGVQFLLWRYFENEVEAVGFKLNDIYFQELLPQSEQLSFIRHKERKFGRGCLDQWRANAQPLKEELARLLGPCETMLVDKPFLLGEMPLFVDFDLYGMLGNYLYSRHHQLPAPCKNLQAWYQRMDKLSPRNIKKPASAQPGKGRS